MTDGTAPDACERCLHRAMLVGRLAPRIDAALGRRDRRAPAALLALDDRALIAAVAGGDGRDGGQAVHAHSHTHHGGGGGAGSGSPAVEAVCRHSDRYPAGLLELNDPPAVLFSAAETADVLARTPRVAIVGTRRPSPYGIEMAETLGRGLAAAGVTVVSGLALGIDAAAHRGALDGGGTPLAVLGGGVDVPYPRANRALHDRVRAAGALVSELPPGQRPYRWSFPARNRIMAALSELTVVVEAAHRSGSLITSEFAAELGRGVCAVPGRATAANARGSNELLRAGAALVTDAADVLDELFGAGCRPAGPTPRKADALPGAAVLDDAELAVLTAIEDGLGPPAVADRLGLDAARVRAALARLERAGVVRRDGLGGYVRAATGARARSP